MKKIFPAKAGKFLQLMGLIRATDSEDPEVITIGIEDIEKGCSISDLMHSVFYLKTFCLHQLCYLIRIVRS